MKKSEFYSYMIEMDLSSNAKLICFLLLHHQNHKTGDCYPSMDTLARESSLCRNSVAKSIEELKKNSIISVFSKRNKGMKFNVNNYVFGFDCSPDAQSNEQSNEQLFDCSPDERSPDEQSFEQSNERSPDAHKPIGTKINQTEKEKENFSSENYKQEKPQTNPEPETTQGEKENGFLQGQTKPDVFQLEEEFKTFFSEQPQRMANRDRTLAAFKEQRLAGAGFITIMSGVEDYTTFVDKTKPEQIIYPVTFLQNKLYLENWLEKIPKPRKDPKAEWRPVAETIYTKAPEC